MAPRRLLSEVHYKQFEHIVHIATHSTSKVVHSWQQVSNANTSSSGKGVVWSVDSAVTGLTRVVPGIDVRMNSFFLHLSVLYLKCIINSLSTPSSKLAMVIDLHEARESVSGRYCCDQANKSGATT